MLLCNKHKKVTLPVYHMWFVILY